MPKFAVEEIRGLPPHRVETFCKLLVDGKCFFDEFCEKMEKDGNQRKALEKIQTIMVEICRGRRVPTKWYQELKHRKTNDPYPDFEIRSRQLRLYLFEDEEAGKIIVLGELKKGKKTQRKTIEKMRSLKLAYFAAKK